MEKERPCWTFENEEQGLKKEAGHTESVGRNNPLREEK